MKIHHSTPVQLAKNSVFTLFTQVVIAVIAIVTLPFIVRGLGFDGYGILSFSIVIFTTLTIIDMGVGRTSTKFIAECVEKGDRERIRSVFWTSFYLQFVTGVLVGLFIYLFSSRIFRVMKVPNIDRGDLNVVLIILCSSAPVILCLSTVRGALEAAQRFDVTNVLKIAVNLSTYLVPLLFLRLRLNIPDIVGALFLVRLLCLALFLGMCYRIYPSLGIYPRNAKASLRSIVRFTSWIAVSNIIIPILCQVDKYFIVGSESFHRLSFYTIPFEVINGIWIIPSSIAAVVYPAFSYYRENASASEDLLYYSSKYIMVLLLPLIVFLFMFSEEILLLWQGAEVARNSAGVLRILLLGVFINSISWVPVNMLTGQGRPDIVAKIHMAQIPLYIVVAYFLIRKYSIGGAAVAFTLRVSFETLLILYSLRVGIWNFFLKSVSGRMICVAVGMLLLNALYKYVFSVNVHIFAYLAVYLLCVRGAVLALPADRLGTGLPAGRGGPGETRKGNDRCSCHLEGCCGMSSRTRSTRSGSCRGSAPPTTT